MQNTRKQEKENQKQLSVQTRVKRLIASRRLNLIKVVNNLPKEIQVCPQCV